MPDLIGCYVCNGIVECWPECPRYRIIEWLRRNPDA